MPLIITSLPLIPNTVPVERLWFSSLWKLDSHVLHSLNRRFKYHSHVLLSFSFQIIIDSPFGAAISFIPGAKHISIATWRKMGGKNFQLNSLLSAL